MQAAQGVIPAVGPGVAAGAVANLNQPLAPERVKCPTFDSKQSDFWVFEGLFENYCDMHNVGAVIETDPVNFNALAPNMQVQQSTFVYQRLKAACQLSLAQIAVRGVIRNNGREAWRQLKQAYGMTENRAHRNYLEEMYSSFKFKSGENTDEFCIRFTKLIEKLGEAGLPKDDIQKRDKVLNALPDIEDPWNVYKKLWDNELNTNPNAFTYMELIQRMRVVEFKFQHENSISKPTSSYGYRFCKCTPDDGYAGIV